jgi:hypothetical protein
MERCTRSLESEPGAIHHGAAAGTRVAAIDLASLWLDAPLEGPAGE